MIKERFFTEDKKIFCSMNCEICEQIVGYRRLFENIPYIHLNGVSVVRCIKCVKVKPKTLDQLNEINSQRIKQ